MKILHFVISLTTHDNDYQIEQAADAEKTAARLGVSAKILYAENDSILQSQQLLQMIQSRSDFRPDGIIFEPVSGTALPQVARAAASAGIGWVVLNRDAEYLTELRQAHRTPIFSVTSDHTEIGRIQGRQFEALLPRGGSVLYIQGPSDSLAAKHRTAGMYDTKPAEVQVKLMKGHWTEASAHHAINSWLRLSTSRNSNMDVIAAQNDVMAMGAKKAFQGLPDDSSRQRWLNLPFIGVDGLPGTGLEWVRQGLLAATVIVPAIAGQALEMLVKAIRGAVVPPERTLTVPKSYPPSDELASPTETRQVVSAGGA